MPRNCIQTKLDFYDTPSPSLNKLLVLPWQRECENDLSFILFTALDSSCAVFLIRWKQVQSAVDLCNFNMDGAKAPRDSVCVDLNNDPTLPGQKCFGEPAELEKAFESRCNCLQSTLFGRCVKKGVRSRVLHVSGTCLMLLASGVLLTVFCRQYLKDFLSWLEGLDQWISIMLFLLMFTLVSFPMMWGYIILNVAAGYLYGFQIGLCTVVFCVSCGVAVSLMACRRFLRGFVESKLQSEHLQAITRVVESRRGFRVVILTRLTPIPFGLQNGLFAITKIGMAKCLLASGLGLLPTQTLNAYMGSSLRTMEDVIQQKNSSGYVVFAVQVLISLGLMWYVIRRARYELNKACLPVGHAPQGKEKLNSALSQNGFVTRDDDTITLHQNGGIDKPLMTAKYGHKRAYSSSVLPNSYNIPMNFIPNGIKSAS